MDNVTRALDRKTPLDGFGYACNKFQFDWIKSHEASVTERDALIEKVDPKIRSTVKRQSRKQKRDVNIENMYEETIKLREARDKGWTEDVERDEGKVFTFLREQDEAHPNLLFDIRVV